MNNTCPYCNKLCLSGAFRFDCTNHQNVIVRFYYQKSEFLIFRTSFIVEYKDKIYAIIKPIDQNCFIEEWVRLQENTYIFVREVIELNYIPQNLTPETALNKLKTILTFL